MSAQKNNDNPWSRKAPSDEWDYVIVGSGMGGMTAGCVLAGLGAKVLVLEQHYAPGGMTHTFKRHDWVWDVGVHAVGEMNEWTMVGRLLNSLTDGKLEWASLGPVYDEFLFPDGVRVDFPDSKQQFIANLEAAFPNEGKAIRRYVREVKWGYLRLLGFLMSRAVHPSFRGFFDWAVVRPQLKHLMETTAQRLDKITDNEKLKTVLAAQWGYYGTAPERSSWPMHAVVTQHFLGGGYYPVGGSNEIAKTMLGFIAARGGWTCIRAEVDEIVVEDGRAVGVRMTKGGKVYRARKGVISAAGARTTVGRLLPEAYRPQNWARALSTLEATPSHVCLYIGFKGDIRKAGATAANRWFYDTWDHEVEEWEVLDPEAVEKGAAILYCSFPSLKDPTHDPGQEQIHTGEVVTYAPWRLFKDWESTRWHKRGEDYEVVKKRLHDVLLEQFLKHMPELRDMVAYTELSTPLSTHHFCRATEGAIYGMAATPERFQNDWLRPRTPLPGLYLGGCDAGLVGIAGALLGGLGAAIAAEPFRVWPFLGRCMVAPPKVRKQLAPAPGKVKQLPAAASSTS